MNPMHESHLNEIIETRLGESASVTESMRDDTAVVKVIAEIATTIVAAYRDGRKVLVCGNGGSAADSSHLVAELVGRFHSDRPPLPAISLTSDASTVSAIANDFSFEEVFSRQVRALGQAGDVLIAISTSGNSGNVIAAVRQATELGMHTVAFTGSSQGELKRLADICLSIPSDKTARIQEAYMTAAHVVCELVERQLDRIGDG